jgi:hypothetical protein
MKGGNVNLKLADLLKEMDRRRESLAAAVQHHREKNDELEQAQRARGEEQIGREAIERLAARLAQAECDG